MVIYIFCGKFGGNPLNFPVRGYKLLHQALSTVTAVCSSHHCAKPSVCWISINKDVFYEFHWLTKLQSRYSLKCVNKKV